MKKIKYLVLSFLLAAGFAGLYWYQKSQFQLTELLVGIGAEAKAGQTAVFDYRGFLYDEKAPRGLGKEFDSTYRRQTPMKIVLGENQAIKGLEKAIIGMKAGGQRQVRLAPSLAYGDQGAGDGLVPADAKLVYIIELRSLE